MPTRPSVRAKNPGVEHLEQRALLSVAGPDSAGRQVAAVIARLDSHKITQASSGETALLNAYFGAAGHEFIALIEKEIKNPLAVITRFESGILNQESIPGFTVKSPPTLQSAYTGLPHDVLALNAAGAVLLKGKQIELGAIVRGPYTTTPFASTIVFAINRGAGARIGPAFASVPGITPDALVTVTVGPNGQGNSATLTDLTTGTTSPLVVPISVAGPTVRILLPQGLLPSEGFAIKNFTFAAWTELQPNAPISGVGSFIPASSMIPIGVETNVSPTF